MNSNIITVVGKIKYLRTKLFKMNFNTLRKEVIDIFTSYRSTIQGIPEYKFVNQEDERFKFRYGTRYFLIIFTIENTIVNPFGLLRTFELIEDEKIEGQFIKHVIDWLEIQIHPNGIEFTTKRVIPRQVLGTIIEDEEKVILPVNFNKQFHNRLIEHISKS